MKRRIRPRSIMMMVVAALLTVVPAAAYAQHAPEAPAVGDHAAHQQAVPGQAKAGVEDLINKMHTANGDEKVAVMADLIERLIEERRSCAAMMERKSTMPMAKPAQTPAAPNPPSR